MVFEEDRRIVIGEGDAAATVLRSGRGNGIGRRPVHEPIQVARLPDVRILAELAGEVAGSGPKRHTLEPG